jgi:hypothetical protein
MAHDSYWHQPQAPYAVRGTGINTTFYFQDNAPGVARLTFVKNGHHVGPPLDLFNERGWPKAGLDEWANAQELETIYPKAGDVVLFFSHIPHQGAKENHEVEGSNIVCHYQGSPFYEGISHVSQPRPFSARFRLLPPPSPSPSICKAELERRKKRRASTRAAFRVRQTRPFVIKFLRSKRRAAA